MPRRDLHRQATLRLGRQFLNRPGFCRGRHVESVCLDADGILATVRPDTLVVDLGTSPVDLTPDQVSRCGAHAFLSKQELANGALLALLISD